MSPSAKERLTFIFGVASELRLEGKPGSPTDAVSECCSFLESIKSPEGLSGQAKERGLKVLQREAPLPWQSEILEALLNVLKDERSRKGLEERLNALRLNAEAHPDRATLAADLMRRALLGELSETTAAVGLPDFVAQMSRMYAGSFNPDDVWNHAWTRLAALLKLSPLEVS